MIQLNLSPEIEAALAKRAEIVGVDLPTLVQGFVAERLAVDVDSKSRPKTYEEAKVILDRIAARHQGVQGFVDDSREAIYAGRGDS